MSRRAANGVTSKRRTDAHRSLGFTSARRAGSHVVRHKARANHLPLGSQGLRGDGILAPPQEEAARQDAARHWRRRGRDASRLASFPGVFAIGRLIFIHATLFALLLLLCGVSWCGNCLSFQFQKCGGKDSASAHAGARRRNPVNSAALPASPLIYARM